MRKSTLVRILFIGVASIPFVCTPKAVFSQYGGGMHSGGGGGFHGGGAFSHGVSARPSHIAAPMAGGWNRNGFPGFDSSSRGDRHWAGWGGMSGGRAGMTPPFVRFVHSRAAGNFRNATVGSSRASADHSSVNADGRWHSFRPAGGAPDSSATARNFAKVAERSSEASIASAARANADGRWHSFGSAGDTSAARAPRGSALIGAITANGPAPSLSAGSNRSSTMAPGATASPTRNGSDQGRNMWANNSRPTTPSRVLPDIENSHFAHTTLRNARFGSIAFGNSAFANSQFPVGTTFGHPFVDLGFGGRRLSFRRFPFSERVFFPHPLFFDRSVFFSTSFFFGSPFFFGPPLLARPSFFLGPGVFIFFGNGFFPRPLFAPLVFNPFVFNAFFFDQSLFFSTSFFFGPRFFFGPPFLLSRPFFPPLLR